jgi:hypothetical protein
MIRELASGARLLHEIAEGIGADVEAVRQAAKRGDGKVFTRIVGDDGRERWGLLTKPIAA